MPRRMKNIERALARMKRLPPAVKEEVDSRLYRKVDQLVGRQKRAAPVDPQSDDPGKFRDSIRAYENPDRPLSYRITADARDADGKFIGGNIEHGHRARDGTHVEASPSFFPTYRAWKRPTKRDLAAGARKALNKIYPKG
ncbi:hypothetical protein SGCZBJ_12565 [Caulobacter zeae]|uniref:HK97 gp10 family phage protein n=1 Tax=Caulobacter zeae TaxID=2055137 RepID=A0A2N5DG66_9CAUL|nr:hypothetical protein [Caulobacter zeae]PLR25063.1 hypothetical protein SGCZBJ_12565 [Caulobacter zeae]